MFGFLIVRPALFVPRDPAATLARLVDREGMARIGVALEMGIVVTQTLAALWFFRLFRSVDDFAAGAIAAFGLVNAIAVFASAAFPATALQVALAPLGAAGVDAQLIVINAFVGYLAADAGPIWGLLVMPATVGEFWMIGYLLAKGVTQRGNLRPEKLEGAT